MRRCKGEPASPRFFRASRWFVATITFNIVIILFLHSRQCSAYAMVKSDDGRHAAAFNGALRLNGAYYHDTEAPAPSSPNHFMNTSVVRFLFEGTLYRHLDFNIDFFGVSGASPAATTGAFTNAALTRSNYRYHRLTQSHFSSSVFTGYGLDRAFIQWNGERISISVGRMPINYSTARMFAVNDFFAPFTASNINTVYKPGVDAIRIAVQTGNLSNIEWVNVLGNDIHSSHMSTTGHISFAHSASLLYAHTLVAGFDLTLLGGRLAKKWIVGGAAQRDIGPFTIYTDGHVGFLDSKNDSIQADTAHIINDKYIHLATGCTWMMDWKSTAFTIEYAFLSNGEVPSRYAILLYTRAYPDEPPYLGTQYAAAAVTSQLHPLLQISTLYMMNLTDGSSQFSTTLSLNLGDNAEWLAGGIIFFGRNMDHTSSPPVLKSEYGASPSTVFTEIRYYF